MGTYLVYMGAQCRPNGRPRAQHVYLYKLGFDRNVYAIVEFCSSYPNFRLSLQQWSSGIQGLYS